LEVMEAGAVVLVVVVGLQGEGEAVTGEVQVMHLLSYPLGLVVEVEDVVQHHWTVSATVSAIVSHRLEWAGTVTPLLTGPEQL